MAFVQIEVPDWSQLGEVKFYHYSKSEMPLADKQRNGLSMRITTASSRIDHAKQAMGINPPLREKCEIPLDVDAEVSFINSVTSAELARYWGRQLSILENLADETAEITFGWYGMWAR